MDGRFWKVMGMVAMCGFFPLGLASCQSVFKSRHKDPPYVVLVNNTGIDLYNVSAREVVRDNDQSARLASVSPLLAGRSYSVKRRPGSNSLANLIQVSWQQRSGNPRSTFVSIEEEMRKASGAANEALVVAVEPYGGVRVFLAPRETVSY